MQKRKHEKKKGFHIQLSVSLLAQLVIVLHWYHRDQGWNPSKPEFFQAFFSQLYKLCI